MVVEEWTPWLVLFHALAINNVSAILSQVDLLERPRSWLKGKFPRFGKIATCMYCQMFWLSVADVLLGPPGWLVALLAIHRVAQVVNEFCDRYLNRAPFAIFDLSRSQPDPPKDGTATGS